MLPCCRAAVLSCCRAVVLAAIKFCRVRIQENVGARWAGWGNDPRDHQSTVLERIRARVDTTTKYFFFVGPRRGNGRVQGGSTLHMADRAARARKMPRTCTEEQITSTSLLCFLLHRPVCQVCAADACLAMLADELLQFPEGFVAGVWRKAVWQPMTATLEFVKAETCFGATAQLRVVADWRLGLGSFWGPWPT